MVPNYPGGSNEARRQHQRSCTGPQARVSITSVLDSEFWSRTTKPRLALTGRWQQPLHGEIQCQRSCERSASTVVRLRQCLIWPKNRASVAMWRSQHRTIGACVRQVGSAHHPRWLSSNDIGTCQTLFLGRQSACVVTPKQKPTQRLACFSSLQFSSGILGNGPRPRHGHEGESLWTSRSLSQDGDRIFNIVDSG